MSKTDVLYLLIKKEMEEDIQTFLNGLTQLSVKTGIVLNGDIGIEFAMNVDCIIEYKLENQKLTSSVRKYEEQND